MLSFIYLHESKAELMVKKNRELSVSIKLGYDRPHVTEILFLSCEPIAVSNTETIEDGDEEVDWD